jgi:hypothetical protein
MRMLKFIPIAVFLCSGAVWGAPPSITGTWVLQSDKNVKLVIDQSDQKIHVQEVEGNDLKEDYTCNLNGKDCDFKQEGHAAKVSLWHNGAKLVELVTRGSDVVKRRFTLAPDGNSLSVEMSRISPSGKNETFAYARADGH